MRPGPAVKLVRTVARQYGYSVVQPEGKRGKGSHEPWVVLDERGTVVGRFGVTAHPREMSWTLMRGIENSLEHLFGPKWMEK